MYIFSSKMSQSLGDFRPPTGASPLDHTGGLPYPDLLRVESKKFLKLNYVLKIILAPDAAAAAVIIFGFCI